MANTYSQIYIQIVFAVKGRQNLIPKTHQEEIHKFITGIVSNLDQKLLSIFCMPDHTHLLVGMKPSVSVSDLTRDIKAGSSGFINEKNWIPGKFQWQEGFGAFSYSRSQIDSVISCVCYLFFIGHMECPNTSETAPIDDYPQNIHLRLV